MKQEVVSPGSWRTHLLITGMVLFTVFLALLLAQMDGLQRQILPSPIAVAITNLNATPTSTPLPAIPLSTGTVAPTSAAVGEDTAASIFPSCANTPPDWLLTSITEGETLLSLSVRYQVSAEKIRLANCLPTDSLLKIDAIYLPNPAATPAPTAVCGPPPTWVLTRVLRDQTMYRLALIHGTTINAILQANCFTSTDLQAGQPIYLPGPNIMPPTATATPSQTSTATSTATATATATSIITSTPTNTAPPVPTVSTTPTSTVTGTPTNTPTASPTASATPTSSITPTVSSTPTATQSPTPSVTPTSSPTSSPSPTATHTLTPTPSSTPTPSATPSHTPTSTPTATATATATNTPTNTATATP